jgi:hypothetical protein
MPARLLLKGAVDDSCTDARVWRSFDIYHPTTGISSSKRNKYPGFRNVINSLA